MWLVKALSYFNLLHMVNIYNKRYLQKIMMVITENKVSRQVDIFGRKNVSK